MSIFVTDKDSDDHRVLPGAHHALGRSLDLLTGCYCAGVLINSWLLILVRLWMQSFEESLRITDLKLDNACYFAQDVENCPLKDCEQSLFCSKICGKKRKKKTKKHQVRVASSSRARLDLRISCVLPFGFLSKRETARSLVL